MLILPIRSHCEICPLPTIQVCWEAWGGGGGADDKFVILLVKKGYDWLHADTRPYPFFTRRITNNIVIIVHVKLLCSFFNMKKN